MRTATVRQIRNAFPSVLRLVRNGEEVAVTYRRKVVATLSPPRKASSVASSRRWAGIAERLLELKKEPMLATSGQELLAQDRERFS